MACYFSRLEGVFVIENTHACIKRAHDIGKLGICGCFRGYRGFDMVAVIGSIARQRSHNRYGS